MTTLKINPQTEGDAKVMARDPYPDLLQTGIQRLKERLKRFGYGLAETRPRADCYFLRFGTDEAGLMVSISVDTAGWQMVMLGKNIRYDTGEITTKTPSLEALDSILQRIEPPRAPNLQTRKREPQQVVESRHNRMAVLAGAIQLSPPTVDDLLGETIWPMNSNKSTMK